MVEHHLAQAASAFRPGGFDEARRPGGRRHRRRNVLRQFPFSQSLGWFYETVAERFGLGNWTSSGRLMGLAGCGNPGRHTFGFLTACAGGSSRRG
ncbi:hypothetical protein AB0M23_06140 [Streptomyces sp. NPDC052077]|uniref:hypothetical protein n=1 Tax=Streptomyces sp. NPDC052077 TaxID=3154757 RepID=UPI0034475964